MSIYTIDFDQTSEELLPPHKRVDDILAMVKSIHEPLQNVELFFRIIREGATGISLFNAGTTYVFSEKVVFQRRVYYRNEITEGYVAGITPTNTDYWVKIADNRIGLSTRIRFTNQKILLEYALNLIFGTTFNQPPSLSAIYIINNNTDDDNFMVGEIDTETSTVAQTDAESDWFVSEFDADFTIADFTVFVPVAVWTALASTSTERNNIILAVVNKYKLFGYTADVQTY